MSTVSDANPDAVGTPVSVAKTNAVANDDEPWWRIKQPRVSLHTDPVWGLKVSKVRARQLHARAARRRARARARVGARLCLRCIQLISDDALTARRPRLRPRPRRRDAR
jgi:hypothetical protein